MILNLLCGIPVWGACPLDVWIEGRPDERYEYLLDLQFIKGRFIAVGWEGPESDPNGVIVSSIDGLTWEKTAIGTNSLVRVGHANGNTIAVGFYPGVVYHSPDLTNWQPVQSPLGAYALFHFDAERFYLGDGGLIFESTNGVNWTQIYKAEGDARIASVAALPEGTFLAGHITDTVQGLLLKRQPDGGWTEIAGPWKGRLNRLVYHDGKYIVAAYRDSPGEFIPARTYIYTSTDLQTWKEIDLSRDDWFLGLEVLNGIVFGVPQSGRLLKSLDGEGWEEYKAFAGSIPTQVMKVAFGNNRYAVLTRLGILISPDVTTPCLKMVPELPKHFLELLGATGKEYEIEVSTDLKSWQAWKRFVAEAGATLLHRDPAENETALFFRARLVSLP